MKRGPVLFVSSILLLGVSVPLRAAPIIDFVDGTTLVTGIQSLEIGGDLYDIRFVEGTYFEVYPSTSEPTFLNQFSLSVAAAAAIAHTLTFSPATDFVRMASVSKNMHVPWSIPTGIQASVGDPGMFASIDPDSQGLFSLDWGFPSATHVFMWPVFTKHLETVPEPNGLLLFSLALAGMRLARKR